MPHAWPDSASVRSCSVGSGRLVSLGNTRAAKGGVWTGFPGANIISTSDLPVAVASLLPSAPAGTQDARFLLVSVPSLASLESPVVVHRSRLPVYSAGVAAAVSDPYVGTR